MANAIYDLGRAAFGNAEIDWLGDTIKAILVDAADYTVNLATDNDLADIPAGARVATSSALTSKTNVAGVMDADDVTWSSVTGDQSEAVVIYLDSGVEATSLLIAYIDSATNLPVTPNGGDITVAWDNGANKIFKL
ncbi:MAG: hypothetical protein COB84_01860 [Rhodobacteraceae bacterium]|nr:MAG: hypothetical protein COB84_01860 [Paracoccaceae bacterium]